MRDVHYGARSVPRRLQSLPRKPDALLQKFNLYHKNQTLYHKRFHTGFSLLSLFSVSCSIHLFNYKTITRKDFVVQITCHNTHPAFTNTGLRIYLKREPKSTFNAYSNVHENAIIAKINNVLQILSNTETNKFGFRLTIQMSQCHICGCGVYVMARDLYHRNFNLYTKTRLSTTKGFIQVSRYYQFSRYGP